MNLENLEFVTGLMGAGKSKTLIEDYKEHSKNYRSTLVLTLSFQNRNFERTRVASRNGTDIPAISISISEQDKIEIDRLRKLLNGRHIVLIDEAQFLSEHLLSILFELSSEGLRIVFYGLSHTFTGELFEASKTLINSLKSDSIIVIESNCEIEGCDKLAMWNARYVDGKIVKTGDTLLESKSTYKAVCDSHFK